MRDYQGRKSIPHLLHQSATVRQQTQLLLRPLSQLLHWQDLHEYYFPFPIWLQSLCANLNCRNQKYIWYSLPARICRRHPLEEENNWKFNLDELEARITEKTKMLILCTPANPTGTMMSRENLEKLSEICIKHDLDYHSSLVEFLQHMGDLITFLL